MSLFSKYPATRWLAPAAAVVLLLGGGAAIQQLTAANADPAALPARTPTELLADVMAARVDGMSGTVVQTSDLGIPDLPGIGAAGGSQLSSLLAGTHTLRVWYSSTTQFRMALLGTLGETDVIRNGADLWMWSSQDNTATHRVVSGDAESQASSGPVTSAGAVTSASASGMATPQMVAKMAVAALTPTTTVTSIANDVVAGRPAYELALEPKDARSLISSVRIAIDGTEHVPLRVQLIARSQAGPVFEVGFSAVDFARPDPAQFTFNPPPGATVTDDRGTLPDTCRAAAATAAGRTAGTAMPRVVGSGWTSVLVATIPDPVETGKRSAPAGCEDAALGSQVSESLSRAVSALPAVSGSWGTGHLLAGKVFSVLVTSDHRIAVGAVSPDLLYQALGA